jgi:hypothetical protein
MYASAMAATLAAVLLVIAPPASADGNTPKSDEQSSSSAFMAGEQISTSGDLAGGSVLAGAKIEAAARVRGNAVLLGGQIRVTGETQGDLYAFGGDVAVDGRVLRNARIAGGQVTLGSAGEVLGDIALAGGDVAIEGKVAGDAKIAGGRVTINGPIGGNVDVRAGQLIIGPNARIEGRLRYHAKDTPTIDPAARVAGGIEALPMRWSRGWVDSARGPVGSGWFGLFVVGVIMILVSPALGGRLLGHLRSRTGASIGFGFLCLVATPMALVLCAITIVGLPLAIVLLLAYLLALLVGYVSGLVTLGQWGLARIAPTRAGAAGWQILALAAALIVVSVLRRLPVVSGLVWLAVTVIGVGALLIEVSRVAHGSSARQSN